MSFKKGKFVYKSEDAHATPTCPSPRKRKRSISLTPAVPLPTPEDDEDDEKLLAALEHYEQSLPLSNTTRPNQEPPTTQTSHVYLEPVTTPSFSKYPRHPPEEDQKEKLVSMDGEIKILRQKLHEHTERSLERDREYHNNLQLIVTEKKLLEEQQRRETESLKANLTFKEREIAELEEKCRTLEQFKAGVTENGVQVAPPSGSGHDSVTYERGGVEFPSVETFIPTSYAIGGSSVLQIAGKKKKRSRSASHTHSTSEISLPGSVSRGSQTVLNIDRVNQTFSSYEITGPQLMRLMLQRSLLSVPNYRELESQLDNIKSPSETKDLSEPLGLLSLFPTTSSPHIPTPPNIHGSSFLVTPVNRRCHMKASSGGPRKEKTIPRLPLKRPLGPPFSVDSDTDNSFSTPSNLPPSNQSLQSLQQSLARLLRSSDMPPSLSSQNRMPHFSFDSLGKDALKALSSTTSDNGVSLLSTFESVLDGYLQEQVLRRKRQGNSDKSVSSLKGGTVTIDSSSGSNIDSSSGNQSENTPQSISQNSSESRSSSYEYLTYINQHPSSSGVYRKKQQALQMALALETLCKYSRLVCEVLVLKPPHYHTSNLVDLSSSSEEDESSGEEFVSKGRLGSLFKTKNKTTLSGLSLADKPHPLVSSDMIPLPCFLGDAVSNSFYIKREQVDREQLENFLTPNNITSSSNGRPCLYTGNLFEVLLSLVLNLYWEEDVELLCSVLDSLTVIASKCRPESLNSYDVLFKQDCVLVSLLLLEKVEVTSRVVSLTIPLTRSPHLVQLFCNNSNTCFLDHLYALYVPRAVVRSIHLKTKIEMQLTRFLFQLTQMKDGEQILYESECCSHQLLKSLAGSLLNVFINLESNVLVDEVINKNEMRVLAESMVRLLHVIYTKDRHIGEHKSECYHSYLIALSKGHEILKGTSVEELLLDLLEYEGIIIDEEEDD